MKVLFETIFLVEAWNGNFIFEVMVEILYAESLCKKKQVEKQHYSFEAAK